MQPFEAVSMCTSYLKTYHCSSTWFFCATCDLFTLSSWCHKPWPPATAQSVVALCRPFIQCRSAASSLHWAAGAELPAVPAGCPAELVPCHLWRAAADVHGAGGGGVRAGHAGQHAQHRAHRPVHGRGEAAVHRPHGRQPPLLLLRWAGAQAAAPPWLLLQWFVGNNSLLNASHGGNYFPWQHRYNLFIRSVGWSRVLIKPTLWVWFLFPQGLALQSWIPWSLCVPTQNIL